MKTLPEQLACAKREAAIRRRVYPQWVAKGQRMTQETAQHEIDCMEDIIRTLNELIKNPEAEAERAKHADRAFHEGKEDHRFNVRPALGSAQPEKSVPPQLATQAKAAMLGEVTPPQNGKLPPIVIGKV